jgi:phosphohistidine phosphatase
MDLILWRHAEAEDSNPAGDPARQLTRRGRKQAERMAHWLRPLLEGEWRILVSPAKRTLQTVAPLDRDFEENAAVGLDATASSVLRAAGWPSGLETEGGERPVLVVGHQPTLGQVAARLIGGAVGNGIAPASDGDLSIRKGAVWWFTTRDRDGVRETILKAVLDPDLLGE